MRRLQLPLSPTPVGRARQGYWPALPRPVWGGPAGPLGLSWHHLTHSSVPGSRVHNPRMGAGQRSMQVPPCASPSQGNPRPCPIRKTPAPPPRGAISPWSSSCLPTVHFDVHPLANTTGHSLHAPSTFCRSAYVPLPTPWVAPPTYGLRSPAHPAAADLHIVIRDRILHLVCLLQPRRPSQRQSQEQPSQRPR